MPYWKKELFKSYDYDKDGMLDIDELTKYFNAIDYRMTIAIYNDLIRFGTDNECLISYQNLLNLWEL